MNSTVLTQTRKFDRLRCDQCGHECSQSDFTGRWNLCDHLALDALAATQSQREKHTLCSENSLKHFHQKDLRPCSCSQGFMGSEFFYGYIHAKFAVPRCLACGKVWGRVVADQQLLRTGKLFFQPSVWTRRSISLQSGSPPEVVTRRS